MDLLKCSLVLSLLIALAAATIARENMVDTLHRLTISEIDELIKQYQDALSGSTLGYNFLLIAKHWSTDSNGKNQLIVYGAENLQNGTFVGVDSTGTGYRLLVYTLDPSWEHLKYCLQNTRVIDWHNDGIMFYSLHEKFLDKLEEIVDKLNLKFSADERQFPTPLFIVNKDIASSYETANVSSLYHVERLKPEDAKIVNDVWPHKHPGSEDYIRQIILVNGGYGVYVNDSKKLIAWALKHIIGTIGLVQVDENYKRKGLGSFIVKFISKEMAKEGFVPSGTILHDNNASIRMFEKLGFTREYNTYFVHLVPK